MPEYTDGTAILIWATLGVGGAAYFITLLINGLAVFIRNTFLK